MRVVLVRVYVQVVLPLCVVLLGVLGEGLLREGGVARAAADAGYGGFTSACGWVAAAAAKGGGDLLFELAAEGAEGVVGV